MKLCHSGKTATRNLEDSLCARPSRRSLQRMVRFGGYPLLSHLRKRETISGEKSSNASATATCPLAAHNAAVTERQKVSSQSRVTHAATRVGTEHQAP